MKIPCQLVQKWPGALFSVMFILLVVLALTSHFWESPAPADFLAAAASGAALGPGVLLLRVQ